MEDKLVNESLNEWFGSKKNVSSNEDNSIIEYLIHYVNNHDSKSFDYMIEPDTSGFRKSYVLSIERDGPNKGTYNKKYDLFTIYKDSAYIDGDQLEADKELIRQLFDLLKIKFVEQAKEDDEMNQKEIVDKKQSRRNRYSIGESLNEGFATNEGRNLDRIVDSLGYDDFEEFIGDNPGCFEVITQWIGETFGDQLKVNFEQEELESLGVYVEYDEDM